MISMGLGWISRSPRAAILIASGGKGRPPSNFRLYVYSRLSWLAGQAGLAGFASIAGIGRLCRLGMLAWFAQLAWLA